MQYPLLCCHTGEPGLSVHVRLGRRYAYNQACGRRHTSLFVKFLPPYVAYFLSREDRSLPALTLGRVCM